MAARLKDDTVTIRRRHGNYSPMPIIPPVPDEHRGGYRFGHGIVSDHQVIIANIGIRNGNKADGI